MERLLGGSTQAAAAALGPGCEPRDEGSEEVVDPVALTLSVGSEVGLGGLGQRDAPGAEVCLERRVALEVGGVPSP